MNKILYNLTYFQKGFLLTNKNWEIYLISLAFSAVPIAQFFSPNLWLSLIFYLSFIFNTGFNLSLPVFLKQKQQRKQLKFTELFAVTLKNTKRIILPGIVILSLIILLFIALGTVLVSFIKPSEEFFAQVVPYLSKLNLVILLFIISFSIFTFTSFLFSLENKGLFASLKGSVILSLKNIYFILPIAAISVILYLIISTLRYDVFWESILRYIIIAYAGLFTSASTLYYYQEVIKKNG